MTQGGNLLLVVQNLQDSQKRGCRLLIIHKFLPLSFFNLDSFSSQALEAHCQLTSEPIDQSCL
jgi:hypothetical protein